MSAKVNRCEKINTIFFRQKHLSSACMKLQLVTQLHAPGITLQRDFARSEIGSKDETMSLKMFGHMAFLEWKMSPNGFNL